MKGTIEKGTREKRTKQRSGILGIAECKIPEGVREKSNRNEEREEGRWEKEERRREVEG